MTTKSIIEVDVLDEKFREFQALFQKYQEQVKSLPGQWGKVNKATTAAATAATVLSEEAEKTAEHVADTAQSAQTAGKKIDGAASSTKKLNVESTKSAELFLKASEAISQSVNKMIEMNKQYKETEKEEKKIDKARKEAAKAERESERRFKEKVKLTKDIAKNVADTTFQLLKWAALGGLVGAATGFFGLGALASGASNIRRESGGLGVTPGELKAARLNFGNYIDAEQTLSNIGQTQSDLSKRWVLQGLGVSGKDITKDPAALLPELLPKLVKAFNQGGRTQQFYEARGLQNIIDFQSLRRLANLPEGELKQASAQYGRDRAALNVADPTLRQMQLLMNQFARAGDQIENTFIRGLAPLAPHFAKLSDSIARTIQTFLSNPQMGHWIDEFGQAIERGAKYLASPEFQQDISEFIKDTGEVASKLKELALALGDFIDFLPTKHNNLTGTEKFLKGDYYEASKTMPAGDFILAGVNKLTGGLLGKPAEAIYGEEKADLSLVGIPYSTGPLSQTPASKAGKADANAFLMNLDRRYLLPQGMLDRVWAAESGRGKSLLSPSGAMGPFQFMPSTAAEFGLTNPYDFEESAQKAATKLKGLMKFYRGDEEKALAGYNYGEGNLNKILAAHPIDWKKDLPQETKGYIEATRSPVMPRMVQNQMPSPNVTVTVQNQTGGSVNINASQLPH